MTAPTPPGAETQNAPGEQPRAAPADQGNRHHYATGALDPRWLLLAGVWYTLAAGVGFAVHYYFSTHATCQLGMLEALCNLDVMAAPGQAALMTLGFLVTLLVASGYGRGNEVVFLSARTAPERRYASPFLRLMCELVEYQRVRLLAWIIAAFIVAGVALEAWRGQFDAVTLTLSAIALIIALRTATFQVRRRRPANSAMDADGPEQLAQEQGLVGEATFWGAIRNTPPISWFASRRRGQARAQQTQPRTQQETVTP